MAAYPTPARAGDVVLTAAALAVLGARTATAATPPALLVFVHAAMKQRAFEEELAGKLPDLNVTAVGRIADMDRALRERPNALMTLPEVLKERRLPIGLQGLQAGQATEPYLLVGVGNAPSPSSVRRLGVLDILGRASTNAFVKELLGAEPDIARVNKVEDLLPLLQLERAEAILLPERLLGAMRDTSRLNLGSHRLQKQVGLPAVAALDAAGQVALDMVRALGNAVSRTLGVDSWR